ncbi:MAG TPA: hypothetical protein VM076_13280 [Gemmatimonadaceae bacterium]|nr:hypothetical protein [Gemmatimonadaceae bacterium]
MSATNELVESAEADTGLVIAPSASESAVMERRHGEEHRYLIAFAVVLAALMQVIDSSIVNVALPDMMGETSARRSTRSRG